MMQWPLLLVLALGADETPTRGGDAPQGKPAAAAQAPDNGRPVLSPAELKALRDTNIFAPKTVKRSTPKYAPRPTSKKESAPAKPKPPMVTGIFYDVKEKAHIVVVEDRNEGSLKQFKEPKFLKAGDLVAGLKVESVSAEKAVFSKGEVSKELRVGDPLADGEVKAVASPTEEGLLAPEEEEPQPATGTPKTSAPAGKTEVKPLDSKQQSDVLDGMRKKAGKKNRSFGEEQ